MTSMGHSAGGVQSHRRGRDPTGTPGPQNGPPRSLGPPTCHRPFHGGRAQMLEWRGLSWNRCPRPGRVATRSCTPTLWHGALPDTISNRNDEGLALSQGACGAVEGVLRGPDQGLSLLARLECAARCQARAGPECDLLKPAARAFSPSSTRKYSTIARAGEQSAVTANDGTHGEGPRRERQGRP